MDGGKKKNRKNHFHRVYNNNNTVRIGATCKFQSDMHIKYAYVEGTYSLLAEKCIRFGGAHKTMGDRFVKRALNIFCLRVVLSPTDPFGGMLFRWG